MSQDFLRSLPLSIYLQWTPKCIEQKPTLTDFLAKSQISGPAERGGLRGPVPVIFETFTMFQL